MTKATTAAKSTVDFMPLRVTDLPAHSNGQSFDNDLRGISFLNLLELDLNIKSKGAPLRSAFELSSDCSLLRCSRVVNHVSVLVQLQFHVLAGVILEGNFVNGFPLPHPTLDVLDRSAANITGKASLERHR